jgi:hypothetical protein
MSGDFFCAIAIAGTIIFRGISQELGSKTRTTWKSVLLVKRHFQRSSEAVSLTLLST